MPRARDARTETEKLLDALIDHWSTWEIHEEFYLSDLAPSLVADPSAGDDEEREILGKLQLSLNQEEWSDLPKLLAERRAGILREIESDRALREAQEREERETERLAALEREREARDRQGVREQANTDRS